MEQSDTIVQKHKLIFQVDGEQKKIRLLVDNQIDARPGRSDFQIIGGARDPIIEFEPDLFRDISDGVRYYPARKYWEPTVRHLREHAKITTDFQK
jgi:hypothetical protein